MNNKKTLILLIPGNPSVPGVYDPFLEQVVLDLKPQGEVISKVLPHLGQCNERNIKLKSVSVMDVVNDHRKTITNLFKKHSPQQTILIGHSLGSAVTICLSEDLEHMIDQFIILCPFLGPSPNNVGYLKLFENPITRFGMIGITHTGLANSKISKRIFKRWLGDNPFNELIPREIKKPFYLRHFFSLVSNYFSDFDKLKIREKVAKMNPEKTYFIFAPNDYWVPDDSTKYLHQKSKYTRCVEISHDFCLKEHQYKLVSKEISSYFKSIS